MTFFYSFFCSFPSSFLFIRQKYHKYTNSKTFPPFVCFVQFSSSASTAGAGGGGSNNNNNNNSNSGTRTGGDSDSEPLEPPPPSSNSRARQKKFLKTFSEMPAKEVVLQSKFLHLSHLCLGRYYCFVLVLEMIILNSYLCMSMYYYRIFVRSCGRYFASGASLHHRELLRFLLQCIRIHHKGRRRKDVRCLLKKKEFKEK